MSVVTSLSGAGTEQGCYREIHIGGARDCSRAIYRASSPRARLHYWIVLLSTLDGTLTAPLEVYAMTSKYQVPADKFVTT
jgi:hypothetical protein